MKRRSMYRLAFSFCSSCSSRSSSSAVVDIVAVVETKEDLEGGEVREEAAGLQAVLLGRHKREACFVIDALPKSSKASLLQS